MNPDRYGKQSILPELGSEGQAKISSGSVLCVGAGGLGCAVLPYLAGAGVGRITVIDDDRIERPNLQRQVLYGDSQVGQSKARVAAGRLADLNPDISIQALEQRLDSSNVEELLHHHQVIVDGSDNYPTKYLLADACTKFRKPLVYGSVTGMEAMVTVFEAGEGPCLRCLFPEAPTGWVPNCAEAGVLGPLVGITGALQATETIKLLVGPKAGLNTLNGRLWLMDARDGTMRMIAVRRRRSCRLCHSDPAAIELGTPPPVRLRQVSVEEVLRMNDRPIFDVRERDEFAAGHIPGAINLPLSELSSGEIAPPAGHSCLIYCETGMRCQSAAELLEQMHYSDIQSLRGGMPAWRAASRTAETARQD